eukprot:m.8222 g.8222  ORF g.8222 m.8222 type:complete len:489 (+) comp2514_c0_seq1:241-1707(+)
MSRTMLVLLAGVIGVGIPAWLMVSRRGSLTSPITEAMIGDSTSVGEPDLSSRHEDAAPALDLQRTPAETTPSPPPQQTRITVTATRPRPITITAATAAAAADTTAPPQRQRKPLPKLPARMATLERAQLIDRLAQVMAEPPAVDVDPQCATPPPVPPHDQVTCSENGFNGRRSPDKLATVYRVMPFGYEADTIEIVLREYQGLKNVKAVLIESALSHKEPFQPKSSQWDRIVNQSRFDGLRDMVVYRSTMPASFITADRARQDAMWASERAQERYGLDDMKQWLGSRLKDTDVVVMGSPDEVLSRHIMHSLVHCELRDSMVGAAIGFPFGFVERAFRPDFRPRGLTYSFTLPTAYSVGRFPWDKIIRYFDPPNKHMYVQGGMHLTGYTLLAAALIKDVSTTDHDGKVVRIQHLCQDGPAKLRADIRARYLSSEGGRATDVTSLSPQEQASYVVPWFLACNRERYPTWFKDTKTVDPRDDDVFAAVCEN